MVSTIVLTAIISRELEPLAVFTAFMKIEMRLVPSIGKRSAWYLAEMNYHTKAEPGLVAIRTRIE